MAIILAVPLVREELRAADRIVKPDGEFPLGPPAPSDFPV
jgi:hypothetical protein